MRASSVLIDLDTLDDLATGCAVLGTGGGGDVGKAASGVMDDLGVEDVPQGGRVSLVDRLLMK